MSRTSAEGTKDARTATESRVANGVEWVLLYAGLPSVAITVTSLLLLTVPSTEPSTVPFLSVLVPVTFTVSFLPLAILCSFFLRTATITKRTAATLPFTTPEQEQ